MKYIENYSNDPRYNLAFEEYCFKYLPRDEDYVILWINGPAIIVGKNQNTIEEVNMDYIKENNINVVRRITGGGAVYHDLGNLNFSIITNADGTKVIDFKKYNIPIVKSLEKLGIQCELSGRNDITIEGKKFSGIAQSIWKDRVLNHGTLLFDTKLDVLSKALNVKQDKIQSKGIKSVKSRVTNIKPYIKDDIDIEQFRNILLKYIFELENIKPIKYELTEEQKGEIDKLFREKYSTWEWNFGESPDFNYKNYKRFPFGSIEVRVEINNGIIKESKIFGDFFGAENIEELENSLVGLKYDKDIVSKYLMEKNIKQYFGDIESSEFIELLFE
ncbi:lipoate--protein ligase [Wansuia hejianensis]|uniref:lipoate--protein ligase n=1 Tax=Wansuia hejianensis TaxID=2763667 RepID=A0A926F0G0_9FIRM|nr:lipoate--protein ligase [Wansuia hejianensis]MBC8590852.1 lipoate--protein ligase [Wansuia hejianensis]